MSGMGAVERHWCSRAGKRDYREHCEEEDIHGPSQRAVRMVVHRPTDRNIGDH